MSLLQELRPLQLMLRQHGLSGESMLKIQCNPDCLNLQGRRESAEGIRNWEFGFWGVKLQ